jgi:hypothetical protein
MRGEGRRWVKITRRVPTHESHPFLLEFHQHLPHKVVACYPTFHVKQSDAILDPSGNELWLGAVCSRNHGYDANSRAYQQCFALARRIVTRDLRLVFAESLIELMPARFHDEPLIRAIADALMGDPHCRTKLIRESSRVQAESEIGSAAWTFAQYARISADNFDRHREEHSRESLGTLRELYRAVLARDPKQAERIPAATPFVDDKADFSQVQASLLVRLYRRIEALPQLALK